MMKNSVASAAKPVPKKKSRSLKKAPQAPKRFKSSYILFFIHVQEKIKKSLPEGQASVSHSSSWTIIIITHVSTLSTTFHR